MENIPSFDSVLSDPKRGVELSTGGLLSMEWVGFGASYRLYSFSNKG